MKKFFAIPLLLSALLTAQTEQTEVRRAAALPSYKDLKFPPLPPLKVPKPAQFTLSNGMKVFLLEDHELPIVSGFALVRTGNLFDPADKRGLAQMTGEVMRSGGTKEKNGNELDVELENMAASVESNIGESAGTVSFSTLKENTDKVLPVFHDVLTFPEFRQDKIDLAKTQMRSSIARRNDDPHGILEREFGSILYGRNTPYGWDTEYSDVDNIQRADLIKFYQRYFFPANIVLAAYGDFNTAEMKDKLERIFAGWTVNQPAVPKFPEVQKTPVPGVYVADKPDVTQTFFAVGHMGGEIRDKDYPALEVTADILGGGFSSRLFQRIRTKEGWAYGIGANWGAHYDHPGLFQITGSTQSIHTVDSLKASIEELNKIRSGEVSSQELQTAKDTVLNGFVFNFDRPSKTLNRLMLYQYYGYPEDFIFRYQKAIDSVTKADVLRVAKEYFKPQDLTIVAVGNPKEFKTPLSELGLTVHPLDLTIPAPPKKGGASKSDAGTRSKGKQLLQQMQAALGGAGKLASVKDISARSDVSISTGGGAMKAQQRNAFILPSIMRQDLQLPFGKQSVYFDGKSGWMAGPQGVQNLPGPVIKQVQGEVFREFVSLALSDRDPNRIINAVANDTIEISDKEGNSATLQLEASGLPVKLTYQGAGPQGPVQIEQSFTNWREIDGIKVPFGATITQGGKKFADATIQEYKINSGLTSDELSKKP
jgi:zinc protease